MIGQDGIKKRLQTLIDNDKFPACTIITGGKGSGKKLLAMEIAKQISSQIIVAPDISIASIRSVIEDAYIKHDTCFIIQDADAMSAAAKNAMLKVAEEPPNNTHIIITLENINNTLDTIKSRSSVFPMDTYSPGQLREYAGKYKLSEDELDIVSKICETPGEVDTMAASGVSEFHEYVELVVNNITEVSGANAFKIPSKVALKDNTEGYDIKLFWKMYVQIIFNQSFNTKGIEQLCKLRQVGITSRYIQELRIKTVSRKMLMDNWILDIRKEALDGSE